FQPRRRKPQEPYSTCFWLPENRGAGEPPALACRRAACTPGFGPLALLALRRLGIHPFRSQGLATAIPGRNCMKASSRSLALLVAVAVSACASPSKAQPLVTNFGTGTLLHPIQEPEALPYPSWCQGQPYHCCKEHVYIFGVNGLN